MFTPLLCKYDGTQNIKGWYASVKIDGVRALYYAKERVCLTRAGNIINLPKDHEIHRLGLNLDFEIWAPDLPFRTIAGSVRKQNPDQSFWDKTQFKVIDCFNPELIEMPFMERLDYIRPAIGLAESISIIPQLMMYTSLAYELYHQLTLAAGHEGTVVRHPDCAWIPGYRNPLWLKRVDRESVEVIVVNAISGKGKYENKLGSLLCRHEGIMFEVGSGFTDEERDLPFGEWPGKIITVEYKILNDSGAPREPTFKGVFNE